MHVTVSGSVNWKKNKSLRLAKSGLTGSKPAMFTEICFDFHHPKFATEL
jgi:hypothetical protein